MSRRQGGFAYLYLLFTIAIVSIALLAEAALRHYEVRRQQEADLIRIGREFQDALISYRASGNIREFPASIEHLLLDRRAGDDRRHLRRIYIDPMTRSPEWGLIREGDRIVGVHSLSQRRPLRVAGFDAEHVHFEGANRYSEWHFIASQHESQMIGQSQSPGQFGLTIGP